MMHEEETPTPERKPTAFQRDLYRARLVIGQLRDAAMAGGKPFQVAGLALAAAALDELWDVPDRVDSHFWKEEHFRRRKGQIRAGSHRRERSAPGRSSGGG
jgi:hypothetical protein